MKDLTNTNTSLQAPELISEIRELIVESRNSVAQVVNSALTLLYWKIGEKINPNNAIETLSDCVSVRKS